ncbi:hypothetical protein V5799_011849 [Amblyomma americanum]|uniref:Regulatory protein zeste n=1 Tax=Amblyomma americanum TaxID=6943 RepID=A0AAQ4EG03_AMBAM
MLEFTEQHPALAHAASPLSVGYTAARRRELWQEVANLLNAVGPVVKSVPLWRHTWQVWCTRCNREEAQFLVAGRGTGGGRRPGLPAGKLRAPDLVQGVADPMFSSSSQACEPAPCVRGGGTRDERPAAGRGALSIWFDMYT